MEFSANHLKVAKKKKLRYASTVTCDVRKPTVGHFPMVSIV